MQIGTRLGRIDMLTVPLGAKNKVQRLEVRHKQRTPNGEFCHRMYLDATGSILIMQVYSEYMKDELGAIWWFEEWEIQYEASVSRHDFPAETCKSA
nr:hypothetical protein CFP56_30858 [Quercus suber]